MFSGIIETVRPVLNIQKSTGQHIVTIRTPRDWNLRGGESVSVEGVCSTVQRIRDRSFEVVYMHETLRRTTLGSLQPSDSVNLERSLRLNSLIGGHLVQGHVDSIARIRSIRADGDARIYEFSVPARYRRYVAEKGSIALDGISLSVAEVRRTSFTVFLLGYTLSHTTLGRKAPGDSVNFEVDMVAKYLERLIRR